MQFILNNLSSDSSDVLTLPQRSLPLGSSSQVDNANQVTRDENRIIPALLFSSNSSTLRLTYHLIFRFHSELSIHHWHLCYLVHLVESVHSPRLGRRTVDALNQLPQTGLLWNFDLPRADHRTVDALKHLPQSGLSWSFDLAVVMKLVLQLLLRQSWTPPFHFISQHEQWLKRTKPSKHVSTGSPELSSSFYDYCIWEWTRPTTKYNYDLPHHTPFRSARYSYSAPKLCDKRARVMCAEGSDCILLLKVVILFLRKADHTSEVARLARKSLPKATLWFPKLMKRARAEMDKYVLQWEGS